MELTATAVLVLEDIIDEARTDVAEREHRGYRVGKSLAPFLLGCFQIACVCVCSEFTARDGREVDGGDCESAANVNGETIRRGPRQ